MDDDMKAIVDRIPMERKSVSDDRLLLWPIVDDQYITVQKWLYIVRQCIDVRSPGIANDAITKCVDALMELHQTLSIQWFIDMDHEEDEKTQNKTDQS